MEVNEGKHWSKNKRKKVSRISLPLSGMVGVSVPFRHVFAAGVGDDFDGVSSGFLEV